MKKNTNKASKESGKSELIWGFSKAEWKDAMEEVMSMRREMRRNKKTKLTVTPERAEEMAAHATDAAKRLKRKGCLECAQEHRELAYVLKSYAKMKREIAKQRELMDLFEDKATARFAHFILDKVEGERK